MAKLGRNDQCHCGSGKKYKNCCLVRDLELELTANDMYEIDYLLTYEDVDEMTTEEIIDRLGGMGIPFNKETFLEEVMQAYSAEEISENWFERYDVTAEGKEEDFPWIAAWILWERFAPKDHLSLEQLDDLHQLGLELYEMDETKAACDIWAIMWDGLKIKRSLEEPKIECLEEIYGGTFSVVEFCLDYSLYLYYAGMEDEDYFRKRARFCREFCQLFPETDELIYTFMRRMIGESYLELEELDEAEVEYKKLIDDFPEFAFGYSGLGEVYGERQDLEQAKSYYERAFELAKNDIEKEMIQQSMEKFLKNK